MACLSSAGDESTASVRDGGYYFLCAADDASLSH